MNQNQQPLSRVNVHEVLEKMQSKKELYEFLILDCQAYLPRIDSINVYFLKSIIRGEKDVSFLELHLYSTSNEPA
jgi:hypothetical protein